MRFVALVCGCFAASCLTLGAQTPSSPAANALVPPTAGLNHIPPMSNGPDASGTTLHFVVPKQSLPELRKNLLVA
jgi:hypothetical protein